MSPKSVLITGCSAGGIGAAVALALAQRGHHVFVTARNTSKIPEQLSLLSNVTILSLDVKSTESIISAAKAVSESGRGLDVLVNNAGAGYVAPVLDMDIRRAQDLFDTNVWGCIRTIQAFGDLLIASRGRVVNLCSIGGVVNMPWISAYAASKSALTSISETLRLELSPLGVTVVTVMAGVITTNFDANNSDFSLPLDSHYYPIEDILSKWASGELKPKGCSAAEFAKSLVGDITGEGNGGMAWRGTNASVVKILTSYAPTFVVDTIMKQGQGLYELSQKLTGRGKALN